MMGWSFDIYQAPKGTFKQEERKIGKNMATVAIHVPDRIIAAGNGGVVTVSWWIEKEERWAFFSKNVPPLAWMPYPKHPHGTEAA